MHEPHQSVFSRVFDAVIFGAGFAGWAAARRLRWAGSSVLLVERSATLLWEASRAFAPDVDAPATNDDWPRFIAELSAAGAARDGLLDGAIAEVAATSGVLRSGPQVLYYVAPVAAWCEKEALCAVAVATKSGLRTLAARRWIDATETGELLAILSTPHAPAAPESQTIYIHLAAAQWDHRDWREIPCPEIASAKLLLRPTMWNNQRVLELRCPGMISRPWQAWLSALRAARNSGLLPADAIVTHGSLVPLSAYAGCPSALRQLPANVVTAIPALSETPVRTLADRFQLGAQAARRLETVDCAASAAAPFDFASDAIRFVQQTADVAVAGLGTGGAIAAIAAAREGASVVAFDPLPFAGGIPSGGGIHWYYYGVRGGLQEELDKRIRQIMPLLGPPEHIAGFHPDARKIVLDQMLHEAGVHIVSPGIVFGVEKHARRVLAGHIATSAAPLRLEAASWIDATGDGDLAAAAGAGCFLGRDIDCQLHAYSQSSGRIALRDGRVRLCLVNYDAGFADPTDPEDLTRARLEGTAHYLQETYTEFERPTYIAAAIGLRQGRQIDCDYNLSLADLIERRTFADSIGLTGCHYDNHAVDYEFESDEAMFWVWICRQWRGTTACEIPYAMLLPRGLNNVWMACRAAGLTPEAHHSFRMQRDIQRIGEAAGVVAALAARRRCGARDVNVSEIRHRLAASGAITLQPRDADAFGPETNIDAFKPVPAPSPDQIDRWIAEMKRSAGPAMYHLWRAEDAARGKILPLLASPDAGVSWRAAAIVAMWADPAAEDRLRLAIRTREYGFDPAEPQRPETSNRLVPNWLAAIVLLRRCGTPACLEDLYQVACDPALVHNARTAIAITCEKLALRHKLSPQEKDLLARMLHKLLAGDIPNAVGNPQRKPAVPETVPPAVPPTARRPVVEDFRWQLHLAAARAEQAAGLPVHDGAKAFLSDPRATVRRAMMTVLQNY